MTKKKGGGGCGPDVTVQCKHSVVRIAQYALLVLID